MSSSQKNKGPRRWVMTPNNDVETHMDHYLQKMIILNLNISALLAQLRNISQYSPSWAERIPDPYWDERRDTEFLKVADTQTHVFATHIAFGKSGGIYGKIWPKPREISHVQAIFNVYPYSSPNTDIIPFLIMIYWVFVLLIFLVQQLLFFTKKDQYSS